MANTEYIERKVIGVLMGFRNGIKTATEVTVQLNILKAANPLLAEDYQKKFVEAARAKSEKK